MVDGPDHLTGPAGSLGGDSNQRPVVAREIFMAIDVVVPLVAIGAMLIALALDDQPEGQIDQVDTAHRAVVIADDQIAFWLWKSRENQAEPQPGLPR
jgi:hypothetical protein